MTRKGFYYCFGCHAKGDAVTFVRETENLDFMEAVERLAREAGMAMPEARPRRRRAGRGRDRARRGDGGGGAVLPRAARPARGRRGARLSRPPRRRPRRPATRFELGFAGGDRTGAPRAPDRARASPPERLVEAGLVAPPGRRRQALRPVPRPHHVPDPRRPRPGHRLRRPRDRRRTQEPKYLNSPETPLFDKGRTLYNVGPARAAAGKAGTLVVVEGYMDVIALAAGRARPRGGAARHRDHRDAAAAALARSPTSRWSRSTATPPARARRSG